MPRKATRTPAGTKRTGTIHRYMPAKPGEPHGHYVVRCSAPDGTRPLFHLKPSPKSPQAEERAKESAAAITEKLWAQGLGAAPVRSRAERAGAAAGDPEAETVTQWFARWLTERDLRDVASVRSDRSRVRKYIDPTLGPLCMKGVRRADLESLVADLDVRVREHRMSWKTALNVWVLVTKAFDDACNAKLQALRVLSENPAASVRGPDRGTVKAKTYLYPSEFLQLVSCEDVPLEWRRRIALAVYLFPRAAELEALTWHDVDTERGIVHIHRAQDRKNVGKTKATKTGITRRFAAESPVLPLLRALHAEANGQTCVDPGMPADVNLARDLRVHMRRAGLDRAELYAADETRKPLGFHDLRATGVTWMAVRGDDPLKIMQRAGHRDFKTTQGYIREAEAIRDGFGDVFPELPKALSGTADRDAKGAIPVPVLSQLLSQNTGPGISLPQSFRDPVPKEGLEPTLPCEKRILNPPRLPIPPLRLGGGVYSRSRFDFPASHRALPLDARLAEARGVS